MGVGGECVTGVISVRLNRLHDILKGIIDLV